MRVKGDLKEFQIPSEIKAELQTPLRPNLKLCSVENYTMRNLRIVGRLQIQPSPKLNFTGAIKRLQSNGVLNIIYT